MANGKNRYSRNNLKKSATFKGNENVSIRNRQENVKYLKGLEKINKTQLRALRDTQKVLDNIEQDQLDNSDCLTLEASAGMHIKSVAKRMIEIAKESKMLVQLNFNGVEIKISPDFAKTEEEITQNFSDEMCRKSDDYKNSPEGIAAKKEQEEIRERRIERGKNSLKDLENLNFSNLKEVLLWMKNFEGAISSGEDYNEIISIFNKNEYEADANAEDDYNGEDSDNAARYIIGQGLSMMKTGYGVHQITPSRVDEWIAKFDKDVILEGGK